MFEKLINQIGEAWTEIVEKHAGDASGDFTLRATFINASIVAGKERNFLRPEAGEDRQWLVDNMDEFQRLADDGDEEFKYLVKEVKERKMI